MFKKLVFSTLLCFGLHSFANESSADVPVQEVAEMAEMAEDVGGFSGAVELKYKNELWMMTPAQVILNIECVPGGLEQSIKSVQAGVLA